MHSIMSTPVLSACKALYFDFAVYTICLYYNMAEMCKHPSHILHTTEDNEKGMNSAMKTPTSSYRQTGLEALYTG